MSYRILVIPGEPISAWISKGEVIDRYFNPGAVFDEVHLLLLTEENPNRESLQRLAGGSKVVTHHLPAGRTLFVKSLGWRPWLLRRWSEHAVRIAADIGPQLVRCHGAHLNGIAAKAIKEKLGIPYVVSMHINPDEDLRGRSGGLKQRIGSRAQRAMEVAVLRSADLVLPVYEAIIPYLKRVGVSRFTVAYNMINPVHLTEKDNFDLHDPVRLICTGRQFDEKDPTNILKALSKIPHAHLTLVGDGPKHGSLKDLAHALGVDPRTTFLPSVPNDDLCRMLPDFDIYVAHSEFWEISKSVLEALLTGLPVVINVRNGPPVPELTDEICLRVSGSADSYARAIQHLITDGERRKQLALEARAAAQRRWAPTITEAHFASIYCDLLQVR